MAAPKKKADFASLLEESFKKRKHLEPGIVYDAKIVSIREDFVFVQTLQDNISGIIDKEEFHNALDKIKVNSKVKVYFLREESGEYYFTVNLTDNNIDTSTLEIAFEKEIPISGTITQEVNGGYNVKLSEFSAFCPFSQIDPLLKASGTLVGKTINFIIHELNLKNNKIVVSQKKISDKEKELKLEILRNQLEIGHYVTCTIKSVHNFGLIVEFDGLSGLIPISESSYKKNPDLTQEFQTGQIVRAKLLSLDWKENKFSLSLKESSNDPWSKNLKIKEGDIIKGVIDSIRNYGLFVKLDDYFNGLVPTKETGITNKTPLHHHFKVGQEIDVFILEINPEKKQIALSISRVKETNEKLDYQRYMSEHTSSSQGTSFGSLLKNALDKKK